MQSKTFLSKVMQTCLECTVYWIKCSGLVFFNNWKKSAILQTVLAAPSPAASCKYFWYTMLNFILWDWYQEVYTGIYIYCWKNYCGSLCSDTALLWALIMTLFFPWSNEILSCNSCHQRFPCLSHGEVAGFGTCLKWLELGSRSKEWPGPMGGKNGKCWKVDLKVKVNQVNWSTSYQELGQGRAVMIWSILLVVIVIL